MKVPPPITRWCFGGGFAAHTPAVIATSTKVNRVMPLGLASPPDGCAIFPCNNSRPDPSGRREEDRRDRSGAVAPPRDRDRTGVALDDAVDDAEAEADAAARLRRRAELGADRDARARVRDLEVDRGTCGQ